MNDMLEGIDVSDVQGFPKWDKVKASGVEYAFCKATEGETYITKRFSYNWKGIKDAGLVRGAYHFARTANDPVKEVKNFIKTVGVLDTEDMLVLDIEDGKNVLSPPQFINWVLTFLQTVEQETNVIPIVYTGGPYFDESGGSKNNKGDWYPDGEVVEKLNKYPLWLAAYSKTPDKYVPYVWKSKGWTMWQRSGDVAAKGDKVLYVPGINVVVDRNQYKGTLENFRNFASSLHLKESERITVIPTMPIDLDLQTDHAVIESPIDVLPAPKNKFVEFFHKIFGIK
jgi:lysozyme